MPAYDSTMKVMVITATFISVLPILLALAMPDWYLGDTQNAVTIDEGDEPLLGSGDGVDIDGLPVVGEDVRIPLVGDENDDDRD